MPGLWAADEGCGMSKAFDRFMIDVEIGGNAKVGRLTDSEFRCLVTGVWPLAAKAPIRGYLLVGAHNAEPEDIARQARCSVQVAKRTLVKLRHLDMLEHSDELGCEQIHDWGDINPTPKVDRTGAERQRRYRAKLRTNSQDRAISGAVKDAVIARDHARCVVCGSEGPVEFHHRTPVVEGGESTVDNLELWCRACHRGDAGHGRDKTVTSRRNGGVTDALVTPPEVEGEVEVPPKAPQGAVTAEFDEWLLDHAVVTGREPPKAGTKARQALVRTFAARRGEGYSLPDLKLATRGAHQDDYRREHNYDRAESVLRPTKVHDLIQNGKRPKAAKPRGDGFGDRLKARTVK